MDISRYNDTQKATVPVTTLKKDLPTSRSQWPPEARVAFSGVLGDLNGWCRENGWPANSNAAVAEEAIRRTWDESQATV